MFKIFSAIQNPSVRPGVKVTVGARESTIGVALRDALIRVKLARGAKPEWGVEWNRSF